jgi:hypothetical protein
MDGFENEPNGYMGHNNQRYTVKVRRVNEKEHVFQS